MRHDRLPPAMAGVLGSAERLEALASYDILDSVYEEPFDDLVALTCLSMKAPAAALVFVDGRRQWHKAEQGLGYRETSLADSVGKYQVADPNPYADVLVIRDLLLDVRTAHIRLCTARGKQIRFYAGVALRSGPYVLGALCVFDSQPRLPGDDALEQLVLLRDLTMAQLESRKQVNLLRRLGAEGLRSRRSSDLDSVTGLLSRTGFEQSLHRVLAEPAPADASSILLLDLDGFGSLGMLPGSDRWNHALKAVARVLGDCTRASDVVGRWRDDDFLILLPGAGSSGAAGVAERISRSLQAGVLIGDERVSLTANIGIVSLDAFRELADSQRYFPK